MTLKNNLYTITATDVTDKGPAFTIALNADSVIYQAHFPEMPVTPGVCIIQLALELLQEALGHKLALTTVKNAKFLAVLQPQGQEVAVAFSNIKQTENNISAQTLISGPDGVNYAKISLQTVIA